MHHETVYPTLEEVSYLHERLIRRFGGTLGLRDSGLIESALARPRSGYYASLAEQAAALLQSLAMNHAFVDGNKRIAFATCVVFLRLNHFCIRVSPDEAEVFLVEQLIAQRLDLPQVATWLEAHMEPL